MTAGGHYVAEGAQPSQAVGPAANRRHRKSCPRLHGTPNGAATSLRLSDRIDEILDQLEERWDQIALEFEELIDEINEGRADEHGTGLDPATELPFHDQMAEQVASSAPDTSGRLISLTRGLVARVRGIIGAVGFWDVAHKQDELRKEIKRTLDDSELFLYEALDELAVECVALAKANQRRLSS